MALSDGQELLHYRIADKIGEGGMGQVWKARDTTLNRDVAIKVLPESLARDEDRLARFEREARALAALNNPHIATIHALHQADDLRFLAMELVPGEDLSERIRRGPLPVEDAMEIAGQIAAALEAAHAQGIVHRDLKPANVKLMPDGKVKVLDFGLAKAWGGEGQGSSPDPSLSPTLTTAGTMAGVILGTAGYMSPEQARGRSVDQRTDIWSLGVILFEMLSGRPVFPGEDVSEILAGVIKSAPPWDELPAGLHAPAKTLLRRCLASREGERLHSAADVRILLQEALEEQRRPRPATPEGMGSRPRSALGRVFPWALTAGALVLVVAALAFWWGGGGTEPSQPATRFHVTPEAGSRYYLSNPPFFDLMPDGRTLIYAAVDAEGTQRLYARPLDSFLATPLVGTEGGESPFVSPSGWIGFVANSKLKRTRLKALSPPVITNVADAFQGGTWSADGTIIYSDDFDSGLLRVPKEGGTPEVLTRPDRERGETLHCLPMALPGGGGVLFTVEYAPTVENPERRRDTMVLELESGETRLLWESTEGPYEYLPSGQLILRRANQLVAIGFDAATLQRTGSITRVLDTENDGMGDTPVLLYATAENGTLVYSSAGPLVTAGLHWVDRDGNAISISDDPVDHIYPDLSADGRRLTVTRENQIWIYELDGGQTMRLTHEGRSVISSWSPDDKTMVFGSYQPDEDLYRIATDGSGSMELLLGQSNRQYPLDWNAETNTLLIQWTHPESGYDLWMLPMDEGGEAKPFLDSPHNERWGTFSPDGRWVVFASDESGRYEIYVRAFPDGGQKRVVSTQGGIEPRWSADGTEIFFSSGGAADLLRPETTMMAVPVTMEGGPRFGPAIVLFSGDYLSAACCDHSYDVAADGQRFVMTGSEPESHRRLNVILHALASFEPGGD